MNFDYCISTIVGLTSLRNTEYGIRNTEYGIRNTEYGIRNTEYGIRNTEYGMEYRHSSEHKRDEESTFRVVTRFEITLAAERLETGFPNTLFTIALHDQETKNGVAKTTSNTIFV